MHQECEFPSLPGFKRSSGAWKKHFCDGAEASLRFRLARRCFYLTYRVNCTGKKMWSTSEERTSLRRQMRLERQLFLISMSESLKARYGRWTEIDQVRKHGNELVLACWGCAGERTQPSSMFFPSRENKHPLQAGEGYPGWELCNPLIPHAKWYFSKPMAKLKASLYFFQYFSSGMFKRRLPWVMSPD